MNRRFLPLLLPIGLAAQDATPKVGGLVQLWYHQVLSGDLRNDAPAATNGNKYYDLSSNVTEDGLVLRRAQLQVTGSVPGAPGLSYHAMADVAVNPTTANATNSNAAYNPTLLQDLFVQYRAANGFEARIGQFKNLQTYEGLVNPAEILFAERSQMGRRFADRRDRGVTAGWSFGDAAFGGKASLGLFNGTNDLAAGKANDLNAQKDLVERLEFHAGTAQTFGLYALQGGTDQREGGVLVAKAFAGSGAPSAQAVLDHKDRTTNLGAFYVFDDGRWHLDAEAVTGQWGRRFPSVGAQGGAAGREALDQRFLSYYATVAYTVGVHTFALRYDFLDANRGRDWYTAFDPYTESAPGVRRVVNGAPVDYTPKYTELTAGYSYALSGPASKAALLRLNLVRRSRNILAPGPGETGAQGGDSLILALQVAL
jgi:hypothetical protein